MRNKKPTTSSKSIQIIYAGGTFGSHGKPLTHIDAKIFTPLLLDTIKQELNLESPTQVEILPNDCVKDSSQLSHQDFIYFYQLILNRYAEGYRQFVLITGTDTLSYLGAFLAEAFAGSDICVVLTGSMRPLFDQQVLHTYERDEISDAWQNLSDAIAIAGYEQSGVRICFSGESWHAQTVQKIHSHDLMAFTGHNRAGYPANSYSKLLPPTRRKHWIEDRSNQLKAVLSQSKEVQIAVIYCTPNSADFLANQLKFYLSQPSATGIILLGFGAGNIPYSKELADIMDEAYHLGHMLVCSTQCAFGGVSTAYAAGSWQYDHHVISGGRLTVAAIYARLLWLHVYYDSVARRRARWTYSINQTDRAQN